MAAMRTLCFMALAAATAHAGPCTVDESGAIVQSHNSTPPTCVLEQWAEHYGDPAMAMCQNVTDHAPADASTDDLQNMCRNAQYDGSWVCWFERGESSCTMREEQGRQILDGDLTIENLAIESLDLSFLHEIHGRLEINLCPHLSTINFGDADGGLSVVTGDIEIKAVGLTEIVWPALRSVSREFEVEYAPHLEEVRFENLETADDKGVQFQDCGSLRLFYAPALQSSDDLKFERCPQLLSHFVDTSDSDESENWFVTECGANCELHPGAMCGSWRERHWLHGCTEVMDPAQCTEESWDAYCAAEENRDEYGNPSHYACTDDQDGRPITIAESREACAAATSEDECHERDGRHNCDRIDHEVVCHAPTAGWADCGVVLGADLDGPVEFRWELGGPAPPCSPQNPTIESFNHPDLLPEDLYWHEVAYADDGTLSAVSVGQNSVGVPAGEYAKFASDHDGSYWFHSESTVVIVWQGGGLAVDLVVDDSVDSHLFEAHLQDPEAHWSGCGPQPPPCDFRLLMDTLASSLAGDIDLGSDATFLSCRGVIDELREVDVVASCDRSP